MGTSIERIFKPTSDPHVFQEIYLHFINFFNDGGQKISSKLDKQIPGKLYRLVGDKEERHSIHGEVEYTFPSGERRKLVALNIHHM